MQVEADQLSFARIVLFAIENLFLMEKHVLAFSGGDETMSFPPLNSLSSQWRTAWGDFQAKIGLRAA